MKATSLAAAVLTTLSFYSRFVTANSLHNRALLVSPSRFNEQDWQHQGCYVDVGRTIYDAVSTDGGMTNAKCTSYCFERGFVYAGTEYFSECYCGNFLARGAKPAEDGDCNTHCAGNSTEACGGRNKLSLYKTSKITPPAVNPGIGDWESMGCHIEGSTGRALERSIGIIPSSNMTAPQCMSACDAEGYALAGVKYGRECFCGNQLKNYARPAVLGGCSMTCTGNRTEFCGGPSRLNLYQNKLRYFPPSSSALPPPASTTDSGATTPTACPNQPAAVGQGWTFDGCYKEGDGVRALHETAYSDNEMTLRDCSNFCDGFAYFGIEYGRECYCGNSFRGGAVKTHQSECSMICPGGLQCDYCGAGNRLSVYLSRKINVDPSRTSVTTVSSTYTTSSSSSDISWGSPSSVSSITPTLSALSSTAGFNSPTPGESPSFVSTSSSASVNATTSWNATAFSTSSPLSSTDISTGSTFTSSNSSSVSVTSGTGNSSSIATVGTNSTSLPGITTAVSLQPSLLTSNWNSTAPTTLHLSPAVTWRNYTSGPWVTSGWNATQTRLPPPPLSSISSEPTVGRNTLPPEPPTRTYSVISASSTPASIVTVIGTSTVTLHPTHTTGVTSSPAISSTEGPSPNNPVPGSFSRSPTEGVSSSIPGRQTASQSPVTGNPGQGSSSYPPSGGPSTTGGRRISSQDPVTAGSSQASSSYSSNPAQSISNPTEAPYSSTGDQATATTESSSVYASHESSQSPGPGPRPSSLRDRPIGLPPFRNTTTRYPFANTTSLTTSLQNYTTETTSFVSTTNAATTLASLTTKPSETVTPSSFPFRNTTSITATFVSSNTFNSTGASTSSISHNNSTELPNTSPVSTTSAAVNQTTAVPSLSSGLFNTRTTALVTSSTTIVTAPFVNSTTSFVPTSSSSNLSTASGITTSSVATTAVNSRSSVPTLNTTSPVVSITPIGSSTPVPKWNTTSSTSSTSIITTSSTPQWNTTSTTRASSTLTTLSTLSVVTSSSRPTGKPSTSASTTTGTFPDGWDSYGCWVDGDQGRILDKQLPDSDVLTLQSCAISCAEAGFTVAGTEFHSQCFCGNYIVNGGAKAKSEEECNAPCSGDSTQICGGGNRMTIMSAGEPKIMLPPTTLKEVGNWKYQGCYVDNIDQTHVFFWQNFFPDVMTPKMCLDRCGSFGYMAAALEYGQECYCGDPQNIVVKKSTKSEEKECNIPCAGDASSLCGGGSRMSTYFWDGEPFYSWDFPEAGTPAAGSYDFLIGGTNIPLITSQAINGKVTFLEKFGTGPPNSTGAYELDLSEIDNWDKAWRTMHVKTDVFCAAGLTLPDKAGRQINVGGWSGASTYGVRLYSPDGTAGTFGKNDWEEDASILKLQDGRWYPTAMNMANGSILVIGGEEGSNSAPVPTLEILPYTGTKPLHMDWLERTDPNNLYPFAAVLPSGGIFVAYWNEARILDENSFATVKTLPMIPGAVNDPKGGRTYPLEGAAVLLPQYAPYTDPLGVLICGGSTNGPGNALDNCVSTYPDAASPKWELERMPSTRVMSCMAPLPDGTYMILNGAHHGVAGFGLGVDPNLNALMYNPKKPLGHRITVMANTTVARLYHSEAITLLDGRVLVTGSDPQDGVNPQEYRIETFTPPYLLSGKPRPKFTVKDTDWTYGQEVTFQLGGAAVNGDITASLLGSVASTHGNSMGARTLFPAVSCSGTSCTVTAPPGKYIAPPGWYQFFVLDGGIPAVGVFVRIGGDPAGLGDWPKGDSFTRPGV